MPGPRQLGLLAAGDAWPLAAHAIEEQDYGGALLLESLSQTRGR